MLSPEVVEGPDGSTIANKNTVFIDHLLGCHAILIAGRAKSRFVAWSVHALHTEMRLVAPTLTGRVCLMGDCMSPPHGGPEANNE